MISALNLLVLVISVVGLIAMAIGVAKLREGNQDRIAVVTLGLGNLWGAWFFVVMALTTLNRMSDSSSTIGRFFVGAYEIESAWLFILGISPVHILLWAASAYCGKRRNATPGVKYLGLGLAVFLVVCMTVFAVLSIWVALN